MRPASAHEIVSQVDLERALDELYSVSLDAFITQRASVARRLEEQGRKDDAKAVRKLRKPTTSAWFVNQLARREADDVQALVSLGERLRASPGPDEMRTAAQERRALVARLLQAAERIAAGSGQALSANVRAAVSQTLVAAGAGTGAEEVAAGRLTHDLEPGGLEGLFGLDLGSEAAAGPEDEEDDALARREAEELDAAAREAEAVSAELTAEAERAREVADAAQRRADEAARRAAEARTRADAAGERLA